MPQKGQNMEANLLCTNRCIKWSLGDPIPSQSKKQLGLGQVLFWARRLGLRIELNLNEATHKNYTCLKLMTLIKSCLRSKSCK